MTSIDLIYLSSVFYDTHHIFLMLPFVPGGDLFTLIHSKHDFKKEDIKGYAYQIVKIFIFLHRNGSGPRQQGFMDNNRSVLGRSGQWILANWYHFTEYFR